MIYWRIKIKYYFRYADDIVILGKDKEELRQLFKDMKEYIETKFFLIVFLRRTWVWYTLYPTKSIPLESTLNICQLSQVRRRYSNIRKRQRRTTSVVQRHERVYWNQTQYKVQIFYLYSLLLRSSLLFNLLIFLQKFFLIVFLRRTWGFCIGSTNW